MNMKPHVIRQGEYVTQLATRFGFDADDVWNRGENAELRQCRPDPNVLAPGDILRIPERPETENRISKGGTHSYRARIPRVAIRIVLEACLQSVSGARYEVRIPGASPVSGTTGGDGVIRFEVPTTVSEVELHLLDSDTVHPVRIGHLDPHDATSGVSGRLSNMGYLPPRLTELFGHHPAPEWTRVESEEERVQQGLGACAEARNLNPAEGADRIVAELRRGHGV